MSYSINRKAIKRVEAHLQQMVAANDELHFPDEKPERLAYLIRQGSNTSRYFIDRGEPFISYAKLLSKFKICTTAHEVVCELRDVTFSSTNQPKQLSQISVPEVFDTLSIIGAAIQHHADTMVFPDANEETIQHAPLMAWCEKNMYEAIVSDNHVTLMRKH